jgi:hypothetical protein
LHKLKYKHCSTNSHRNANSQRQESHFPDSLKATDGEKAESQHFIRLWEGNQLVSTPRLKCSAMYVKLGKFEKIEFQKINKDI